LLPLLTETWHLCTDSCVCRAPDRRNAGCGHPPGDRGVAHVLAVATTLVTALASLRELRVCRSAGARDTPSRRWVSRASARVGAAPPLTCQSICGCCNERSLAPAAGLYPVKQAPLGGHVRLGLDSPSRGARKCSCRAPCTSSLFASSHTGGTVGITYQAPTRAPGCAPHLRPAAALGAAA